MLTQRSKLTIKRLFSWQGQERAKPEFIPDQGCFESITDNSS